MRINTCFHGGRPENDGTFKWIMGQGVNSKSRKLSSRHCKQWRFLSRGGRTYFLLFHSVEKCGRGGFYIKRKPIWGRKKRKKIRPGTLLPLKDYKESPKGRVNCNLTLSKSSKWSVVTTTNLSACKLFARCASRLTTISYGQEGRIHHRKQEITSYTLCFPFILQLGLFSEWRVQVNSLWFLFMHFYAIKPRPIYIRSTHSVFLTF